MKIHPHLVDRFIQAERGFDACTRQFNNFVKTLGYFAEPKCDVRGVVVSTTDDPLYIVATYRTVSIGIRMLCELSDRGVASGRVVCTLLEPSFKVEKRLLGAFSFDKHGLTDIERSVEEDPVEMEWAASVIVLNFLNLALQQHEN